MGTAKRASKIVKGKESVTLDKPRIVMRVTMVVTIVITMKIERAVIVIIIKMHITGCGRIVRRAE
jgi:hypothetical protein